MRMLNEKIWLVDKDGEYRASVTFDASMQHLSRKTIPFEQSLQIREELKRDIYKQIFGHMPQTCLTTMRHLKTVEKELRNLGHEKLANRLASSGALIDSLYDQMTPYGSQTAPVLPTIGKEVDLTQQKQ